MTDEELRKQIHDLDVTVWVGKGGLGSAIEEFESQMEQNELVKVKFLRAARGGTTTDDLADDLAERSGAEIVDVRGNTAVFH